MEPPSEAKGTDTKTAEAIDRLKERLAGTALALVHSEQRRAELLAELTSVKACLQAEREYWRALEAKMPLVSSDSGLVPNSLGGPSSKAVTETQDLVLDLYPGGPRS